MVTKPERAIAPLPILPALDITEYESNRTSVPLTCKDGAHHGTVINGRYLRVLCRRARTRQGYRVYHLFDLATGVHLRDEEEPVGRDSRQGAV